MVNAKEILRLKEGGATYREIAQVLKCSQSTVSKTIKAAEEKAISLKELAGTDDEAACQLLFGPRKRESVYYLPDWAETDEKLRRDGVNLALLWDEYTRECAQANLKGYQYSQFANLYKAWKKKHGSPAVLTKRITHKPAHLLEVDWAADRPKYIDFTSGEIIQAWAFVACLPYSQRLYVEAFDDMSTRSWIQAHINTFTYNKGVAMLTTPDNCKTAVQKPDYYDPQINKDYARLAAHYGCSILPARPFHPKDKGSTENTVKFIETWVIAYLREERFFSLGELNVAIRKRIDVLNNQPFQSFDYSRNDVFENEEQHLLRSLPQKPFELCEWRKSKVNIDYCIQVERQKYSVPYRYVGEYVDVRITARTIEVFKDSERICSHTRLFGRFNQSSITEEHMPDEHRLYAEEWNPDRLKKWAASVGTSWTGYTSIDRFIKAHKTVDEGGRPCHKEGESASFPRSSSARWSVCTTPENPRPRYVGNTT
jgi:transposase